MTTFTIGPATATTSSCAGFSGIRGISTTPRWQQDHLRRLDPEAAHHEDMAEFVEDDADEDERNESTLSRRRTPSLQPALTPNPGEEEKEGEMNPRPVAPKQPIVTQTSTSSGAIFQ